MRTLRVAEQLAAQCRKEERANEYANARLEHKKQQFGDQEIRKARVACEEAARLHNELARTNAETALNLRNYEVRKEVNADYLEKLKA
jgi:hypothetical protein